MKQTAKFLLFKLRTFVFFFQQLINQSALWRSWQRHTSEAGSLEVRAALVVLLAAEVAGAALTSGEGLAAAAHAAA